MPQDFRNTRPRRRQSVFPNKTKGPAITIFEDVREDEELVIDDNKRLEGKTLLGRPAQKIPRRMPKEPTIEEPVHPSLREVGPARRRSSFMQTDAGPSIGDQQPEPVHRAGTGRPRDFRRRTIFVPSDDTTIMTIHPGANITDRLNDTFQLPESHAPVNSSGQEEDQVEDLIAFRKPLKRPRKSLTAAPRRMPLQQMDIKQNVPATDVRGEGGGKENMPPFAATRQHELKQKTETVMVTGARDSAISSRLFEPTAASHSRQSIVPRKSMPVPRRISMAPKTKTVKFQQPETYLSDPNSAIKPVHTSALSQGNGSSRENSLDAHGAQRLSSTSKKPDLSQFLACKKLEMQAAKLNQYPVLSEDLAQPELYEDGWLSHQEVALTEIVNGILSSVEPTKADQPVKAVRDSLVQIYHQPEVSTLYKRLQASLLYSALSRPKEMTSSLNPDKDIGLRKRFISLWIDNYNETCLLAAAEVVVGRRIVPRPGSSAHAFGDAENLLDPHASTRAITGFLDTFFVSVHDAEFNTEPRGVEEERERERDSVRWRKTLLRSLMLIWLLDRAKESGAVTGCLFKHNSAKKSSVTVLHALSSLLMPSVGDIGRALRHMDYEVLYIQDPLDEIPYRIDNLAVDLRDGVLLSRLVEVLLYSQRSVRRTLDCNEATVTITLPDATTLESMIYPAEKTTVPPRVLSQHLKLPCLGRAQKLHNVQVALSALKGFDVYAAHVYDGLNADDIVDGHREKSLSFLWSLVSVYGLEYLVDYKELAADVRRAVDVGGYPLLQTLDQENPEKLLQAWATVYGTRSHVRVTNLTTSFADGRAYAAIIEGFSAYIPCTGQVRLSGSSTGVKTLLETRLRALGCSSAFKKQLSSTLGIIPARETTISNLAFLASRLLPLARTYHAAEVIQRAYRQRRARTIASQRIALMRLAHACATVAQTSNRIIAAATLLQRSWRRVLNSRIERLHRNVTSFQTLAKGWTARRKFIVGQSLGKNSVHSCRLMGGW